MAGVYYSELSQATYLFFSKLPLIQKRGYKFTNDYLSFAGVNSSYKNILKIALPIMAGALVQSIVMITDSAFLSRIEDQNGIPFVASGNSGMIYVSFTMILAGIMEGAQIIISRRIGAKQNEEVGRVFRHSYLSAVIFGLFILMLHQFASGPAFQQIVDHPEIASSMTEFLKIRSWGIIPMSLQIAFSAFYLGSGRSSIFMVSNIIFAVSNVILDYGMIFGNFGLPEMGLQGAALASVIAESIGAVFVITYGITDKKHRIYGLFKTLRFEAAIFKRILKVSAPLMVQGILAMGTWTVFFTMIEHMGKDELEISHTLRNLYFIAFVPFFGFAATTKTMVSRFIGAGKQADLKLLIRRIIVLNVLFLFLTMHGTWLYPEYIIKLINPNEVLIAETVPLLHLISGSMLIFSVTTILFNTVSGSGNTSVSMIIEFVAIVSYLIVAALLIYVFEASIFYVWMVEYLYFFLIGLIAVVYLKKSNWKNKTV